MPLSARGGPGFHLCFAVGLMSLAIITRLYCSWLVVGASEDAAPVVLLFCWGTLPYLALVALTWVIRYRGVSLAASVLLAATDIVALRGALVGIRSTSGLGIFLQPALGLLVIVPAATVTGVGLRLGSVWRRRRRAKHAPRSLSD